MEHANIFRNFQKRELLASPNLEDLSCTYLIGLSESEVNSIQLQQILGFIYNGYATEDNNI